VTEPVKMKSRCNLIRKVGNLAVLQCNQKQEVMMMVFIITLGETMY